MNNSEDGIVTEVINATTDLVSNKCVEQGIEVVAEVSIDNIENSDKIKVIFAPDARTLLHQAKNLFWRIHTCSRAMMFQKLAERYKEISNTGIFPEYGAETIQVHVSIFVPAGIVADLNSAEIAFTPKDIGETCVFDHKDVNRAKVALLRQLLENFATRGGH